VPGGWSRPDGYDFQFQFRKAVEKAIRPATFYFFFAFFARLLEDVIEQPIGGPKPIGDLKLFLAPFCFGAVFGLMMLLVFVLEQRVLASRGIQASDEDLAYYPRPRALKMLFTSARSRLLVMAGFLLIAGYWVFTEIGLYEARHRPHGNIWPPTRIQFVLQFGWALLWTADCLNRPNRERLGSALAFLTLTWMFVFSLGELVE
jgi:hypothetical protein